MHVLLMVCMNGLVVEAGVQELVASLASATASVALLAPLASHDMPTLCLSIIEVIKLSG